GPGGRPIADGDRILVIGKQPIRSALDVIGQSMTLRTAESRMLRPGDEPWNSGGFSYHWLTEEPDGDRWVQIEIERRESGQTETGWVAVQSLPADEIILSFVWLVLHLGIVSVAAAAFWQRPFDRPSRMFFALCLATTGAFVGGFHLWVIAGSMWLVLPFAASAVLLPAVLLHFFLIYPRPRPRIAASRAVWIALYAIPLLALVLLFVQLGRIAWLHSSQADTRALAQVDQALDWLRRGVYAYLGVASLYFVLALLALRTSLAAARTPQEYRPLQWIWRGSLVASGFVGYALSLALFRPDEFALGAGRLPMFLASVAFLLAYAVAIVRYRVMLGEQGPSRSVLYYAVSSGLAVAFSLAVVFSALLPGWLNISLTSHQAVAGGALLMLSVALLLWVRDRLQQRIDRRFFREKYRLDEALERINRAAGRVGEPAALAQMMLTSCRDVLGVERGALYLRSAGAGEFELLAVDGGTAPAELGSDEPFVSILEIDGTLDRASLGGHREKSAVQEVLGRLAANLVHALEVDRQIAGLVFLGPKDSGGAFTAEDLTFLHALGQVTTAALANARTVAQNLARTNEELRLRLEKITEQQRRIAVLQAELAGVNGGPEAGDAAASGEFRRGNLRGHSPAIEGVLDTVRKVASSTSSVLIRGESGTGKELLAQVLHDNSPRHAGPMIRVHCAALSPTLLESELFGHVKGAFTGAHRDTIGRFEAAHGGTLFLDEIGDISLETQIKLLRVLQERCFEPVGGSQTVHVDVRLITATHQNLEELISRGAFREDLYYRLNVITVTLPPLRERREDIFELALYFLGRAGRRAGKRVSQIDDAAVEALERYDWPGNIRELENVVERAVVLAEGDRITRDDLPAGVVAGRAAGPAYLVETKPASRRRAAAGSSARTAAPEPSPAEVDGDERARLEAALQQCGGNKAQAARLLGLARSTYFSKLKKYGLD
ncbi:MAG TPA: sigma 54-interacting transcriptional regulator, partial [Planctomycetaceae bacterium]|nr:sigma 54-interacting transcriptional regulator [Planctomycetaceae bacterium]